MTMVWMLQAFPVAREDQAPLQVMLQSFMDAQMRACRPEEEVGSFGCCRVCRRWGEGSVAPRAEWRAPVDCWMFGEGDGRFELGCGVLWRKFAGWVIFG